jgi:threonine/homoserine/homoserine lactone efflux protein
MILLILLGALLVIYLAVNCARRWFRTDDEKRAHRRFGGTAPKK